MRAYYNENDPSAAAWLRELIRRGLIADGEVDERSICDVRPADLAGFRQAHFFAGIGGWSYALRIAGWPDDRPVWTGSCPCQPFSTAGKGLGTADPRHLWPVWSGLIRECRPAVVFGEQVASAIAHGWLDAVCDDMEGAGYACGAAVLPACSVGAPHKRERLWWVATNTNGEPKRMDVLRCRSEAGSGPPASSWAVDAVDADIGPPIGRLSVPQPPCGWVDDGLPGRVVRGCGYGNAIVPQVAAVLIAAYLDTTALRG